MSEEMDEMHQSLSEILVSFGLDEVPYRLVGPVHVSVPCCWTKEERE